MVCSDSGENEVVTYFWLSFADPERPEGSQFLGAALVKEQVLEDAMTRSHVLGINPGGEVKALGPIPVEHLPANAPLDQLLSRSDMEGLGWEAQQWEDE